MTDVVRVEKYLLRKDGIMVKRSHDEQTILQKAGASTIIRQRRRDFNYKIERTIPFRSERI